MNTQNNKMTNLVKKERLQLNFLHVGGRAAIGVAACLACVAAAVVDRKARQSCRVWRGGVN